MHRDGYRRDREKFLMYRFWGSHTQNTRLTKTRKSSTYTHKREHENIVRLGKQLLSKRWANQGQGAVFATVFHLFFKIMILLPHFLFYLRSSPNPILVPLQIYVTFSFVCYYKHTCCVYIHIFPNRTCSAWTTPACMHGLRVEPLPWFPDLSKFP